MTTASMAASATTKPATTTSTSTTEKDSEEEGVASGVKTQSETAEEELLKNSIKDEPLTQALVDAEPLPPGMVSKNAASSKQIVQSADCKAEALSTAVKTSPVATVETSLDNTATESGTAPLSEDAEINELETGAAASAGIEPPSGDAVLADESLLDASTVQDKPEKDDTGVRKSKRKKIERVDIASAEQNIDSADSGEDQVCDDVAAKKTAKRTPKGKGRGRGRGRGTRGKKKK